MVRHRNSRKGTNHPPHIQEPTCTNKPQSQSLLFPFSHVGVTLSRKALRKNRRVHDLNLRCTPPASASFPFVQKDLVSSKNLQDFAGLARGGDLKIGTYFLPNKSPSEGAWTDPCLCSINPFKQGPTSDHRDFGTEGT
ncbi:hypothetical protein TWF106_009844 [Orbilia oligospora]|uniref:Uncharacterized protein n=1 Tax=Orbilia oligospora TaxID=2813651 RepID=A0A7C8V0R3_ORBOL|nr:hypothetical protein TWF788_009389 [Orbilia oligospora]KAF3227326.1 hypothetical protein TWF106_009844 [Orbilia oligospora]